MTKNVDSQSHLAYLALEQQIVTLKLAPGALVNERQLIELSGYGRTPVREAIQKLEWQRLILVRPRVGLQIAEIQPSDHQAIMAVRLKLEPLLANAAAQNADDGQRAALLECAKAMTAAATGGSFDGFLTADKAFDEVLEEACANRFLVSAVAPLQSHSRRMWYATATVDRMDRSVALHVAVIRAIQQGQSDAAQKAMEALIGHLSEP
ncbi:MULTISPECIES: GntR family transcriptional regulator [Alphaproteobacteria]|uniref:GntR family transcriptional regulator n=2 Tax=Alphaproteobacteria TaxID=28211 RepID=A0A512HCX0_9HYPH|nr:MULTISPECIES: GntR family transcriptional regulator [Alphaproteobacteria]GEO83296.1 GntR family transcriptional regulator [Ciceribacter naphthalenivorans]GLR20309.1 GntR family transcriptional regulator [Ciceribacter naphthalenivorans]GLT03165.1 GntR family transcriptional regulator [Sphingomonas psychrolutea]